MSRNEAAPKAPKTPAPTSRGRWILAAVLVTVAIALALIGTGWLGSTVDRLTGRGGVEAEAVVGRQAAPRTGSPDSATADDGRARAAATASDPVEAAEEELRAAWVEHDDARAALAEADAEIAEIEREIEAIERYVDDLEQRGEDPAKHAFEAMERLDPVIERFQVASRVADEAEAAEAAAAMRVSWAEAALEDLRTQRED